MNLILRKTEALKGKRKGDIIHHGNFNYLITDGEAEDSPWYIVIKVERDDDGIWREVQPAPAPVREARDVQPLRVQLRPTLSNEDDDIDETSIFD